MREFIFTSQPSRVVFGAGTLDRLREEVERLGCSRALVVTTPGRSAQAGRIAGILGPCRAAEFTDAAQHTPVEVTERALAVVAEHSADCLVAVGGGSAIGLSKALADRTGLPQAVVPTTYSGSETTPVLASTDAGVKTTRVEPRIRPETVVYDVDLTLTLPAPLSVASGVNAMAHAVEALYAPQANPATDALALRAVESLAGALPRIATDPADREARADALTGAWLAGSCLATLGMGLHHAICHTLGGSFGLPHAETHAALLPYVMAHNASAVPEVMDRLARALGADDAPGAVHDLVRSSYGPLSLRHLGLAEGDLAEAARLTVARSYANPRPPTRDGVADLLRRAWTGDRPVSASRPAGQLRALTEQVTASLAAAPDARSRELLTDLVRRLHGFVADNDLTQDEWQHAIDFLTRAGHITTDTRQEFILLSDTLGVSSAVDLLANSRTADSTPSAVLGPFYVAGPPRVSRAPTSPRGCPAPRCTSRS